MDKTEQAAKWPGISKLAKNLIMGDEGVEAELRRALEPLMAWNERAFVLLAGLHEAVDWELAPPIKKEIAELVKTEELTSWRK